MKQSDAGFGRHARRTVLGLALIGAAGAGGAAESPAEGAAGWAVRPYAAVRAEAWSNGVPVFELDGDWSSHYRARRDTQRAEVQGRAEAGVAVAFDEAGRANPWRIGALARVDGTARLSGEAAQVLYHYQSRTDPQAPVRYNADTDLMMWAGRGVAIHLPAVRMGQLGMEVGWDQLILQRLRTIQSAGEVAYQADDSYAFRGTLRDDNHKATTPFLPPARSQGQGQALSVGLIWTRAEGPSTLWPDRWRLDVRDVWSRLTWSDLVRDDAVLDSAVSTRTPDGRIAYRAAINGQYSQIDAVKRIPVSTRWQGDWDRPSGTWSLTVAHRIGLWQRWVDWQAPGAVRWRVGLEPFFGVARVGVAWRGLEASVMSGWGEASGHVRGLQMNWLLGF